MSYLSILITVLLLHQTVGKEDTDGKSNNIIRQVDALNVICPDGSECQDGSTCCARASGRYGCCPYPNAVCCSDGEHCCPSGDTCDVAAGTCLRRSKAVKMFSKMPAAKALNVICPDGSECPDGNTCCLLAAGGYGCCPLPDAVCCSDGKHCCPSGYTCDVSTCSRRSETVKMFSKIPATKALNVICPDGSECQDGSTCCARASGRYGCCPYPNAVCCSDGEHCCPSGDTCDVAAGTCLRRSKAVKMFSKMPAAKAVSVICPGGQAECPDGNTCCLLPSGEYGCCPLPNAVCCSDGESCCPSGYTCDVSSGTCSRNSETVKMFSKIPATKALNVVCPGGEVQCPGGTTCCLLPSGQYGCCPFPNAVCCSDRKHCCPSGYTCDVSSGTCSRRSETVKMFSKIPATKAGNVICPDGSECPDGNTCCLVAGGRYGCCPLPNAVCCSDRKHCCPSGYTCDVSSRTCSRRSETVKMFSKIPATKEMTDIKTMHKNPMA